MLLSILNLMNNNKKVKDKDNPWKQKTSIQKIANKILENLEKQETKEQLCGTIIKDKNNESASGK